VTTAEDIPPAAESLDDQIARLERELAAKKAEKERGSLEGQVEDLAGFFLCLSPFHETDQPAPIEHLRIAIEVLRAAKAKYDHRIAVLAAAPPGTAPRLLAAAPAGDADPPGVVFDGTAWRWTIRRPGGKSVQGEPFASREAAEMDLARFLALNDGGAPFQPSKAFRDAGTGSIRRNGPGWQWNLQRDGERLLSKTWPTREAAEAELARVVADPTFVPAPRAVRAEGKAPSGQGSIQATGNGFQWRLSRNGKVERSRSWATREEAAAELAQVIADPAFVPAPKERERVTGRGPDHCSKCGEVGHRAPGCGREPLPVVPVLSRSERMRAVWEERHKADGTPGEESASASARVVPTPRFSMAETSDVDDSRAQVQRNARARRRAEEAERLAATTPAAEDAVEDDLPAEDDAEGWTPPDSDGRQTCIPCDGEGIDNRPGPGAGNCCLHCEGEGYRWVETVAAERRSA